MHTNVEYLICCEVEALGYFQLSDKRYDDKNVVTERMWFTNWRVREIDDVTFLLI